MKSSEIRKKFIQFFIQKGHKQIPGASLVPEADPTVLFTTAGMHPLIPYLLGQKHPQGKRLVNYQKCLRTDDIDEVGDSTHLTFFEMLGNWSLGDYFKKEAIELSYEFLTDKKWLGLDPKKIYVSVFEGDRNAPKDVESAKIWQSLGIPKERIYYLGKEENWWGPAGKTGPCGPCTEMFYDSGIKKCSAGCKPGCNCGKYVEIWNDVFMTYNKTASGKYKPLKQKNVDTGMGLERTAMVLQNVESVFETDLFSNIIDKVTELAKVTPKNTGQASVTKEIEKSIRIIADHLRAVTFAIADGVAPSNLDQGYVVRRLTRRAIRYGRISGIEQNFCSKIAQVVISDYKDIYPELEKNQKRILEELDKEEEKFSKIQRKSKDILIRVRQEIEEFLIKEGKPARGKTKLGYCWKGREYSIDKLGEFAFYLYETYAIPPEQTYEELESIESLPLNESDFHDSYQKAFKKHQQLSRAGAKDKFKGGLADAKKETIKLHTTTHLLQQALRDVLGEHVKQAGSNIIPQRLRFDFSHSEKMTEEEIKKVEKIVNDKIKEKLPVKVEEMSFDEAIKSGALAVYSKDKYPEKVKVYSVGDYSREICGGPHVKNTSELGEFRIKKEQASSAGVRRIKAVLK